MLLPRNSLFRNQESLEPHKPVAVIRRREPFALFLLVLEHPLEEIACHPDVKGAAPAGYDVRAIDLLLNSRSLY